MKGIFGKAFNILEHAIELRTKRNTVLASNIANVDTPAYKPKDIPFKEIMSRYLESSADPSSMKRTQHGHMAPTPSLTTSHEKHFPWGSQQPHETNELVHSTETGTPNSVDLDQEMAKLAANNLEYQAAVQALIRELELLRTAITEGGKV